MINQRLFNHHAILVYLALIKLILHLVTLSAYGYHSLELIYLSAGSNPNRLAPELGPLTVLLFDGFQWIFGSTLFAARFLSALAGGMLVMLCGYLILLLNGRRFALYFASVCIIVAPIFLQSHAIFHGDPISQLIWLGTVIIICHILKKPEAPQYWLLYAGLIGIGCYVDLSIIWLLILLIPAFLLHSHRIYLLSIWPWLSVGISLFIASPILIGGGSPYFAGSALDPIWIDRFQDSWLQLAWLFHPTSVPVWLLGLYFFIFRKHHRSYRILAATLLIIAFIRLSQYSPASLTVLMPILIAAGSVQLENWLSAIAGHYVKPFIVTGMLLWGTLTLPFGLSIVPINWLPVYNQLMLQSFNLYSPLRTATGDPSAVEERARIPSFFLQMLYWGELGIEVEKIKASIEPKHQILTRTSDQAAAISFFVDLPDSQLSYFSQDSLSQMKPQSPILAIGFTREVLYKHYLRVRKKGEVLRFLAAPADSVWILYQCESPRKTRPGINSTLFPAGESP